MNESQRERQKKTLPNGDVVVEAGKEHRFIFSPSGTVHERLPWRGSDGGYELDPKCGQTLSVGSVWGGIDADSAEQVATKYERTQFCSKCFRNSLKLAQMAREAREERRFGDSE